MTAAKHNPPVDRLADELFTKIERSQGYAYVSDGEHFPTTAQLFDRIRGRLGHAKAVVAIFEDFLKKHGELPKN